MPVGRWVGVSVAVLVSVCVAVAVSTGIPVAVGLSGDAGSINPIDSSVGTTVSFRAETARSARVTGCLFGKMAVVKSKKKQTSAPTMRRARIL